MRSDPTLFDDAGTGGAEPPGSSPAAAWSVSALNAAVRAALSVAFPDRVWVRGEVVGLKRGRNGHAYFDLVDHPEAVRSATAQIPTVAFASRWRTVEWRLQRARIRLDDGMQVCFRGRLEVYEAQGRLQFVVEDVDPEWTLGHMAAGRYRVLQALESEGLLRRNGTVPMPAVPLVVGLVTSAGSAAYNDFVQELGHSGFGFRLLVVDTQTQGPGTVASTVRALHTLEQHNVDVVALVRGGGARTDLACFDDDRIARTIAAIAVPVITGIGHEIDSCVADAVAHTCCKTPTAAAHHLVGVVSEFDTSVHLTWRNIAQGAGASVSRVGAALDSNGSRVRRAATHRVQSIDQRVSGLGASVRRSSRALVTRTDTRLEADRRRLAPARLLHRLDTPTARLDDTARRVRRRVLDRLDTSEATVTAAAQSARAYNPARVLERGFSLTLDASGRAVHDASAVAPGDIVRTRLARGVIRSSVVDADEEET